MHSGITGLIDIAYNKRAIPLLLSWNNSTTGMTGHQQNPTTEKNIYNEPAAAVDLEALCKAVGVQRVTVVDPFNLKQVHCFKRRTGCGRTICNYRASPLCTAENC